MYCKIHDSLIPQFAVTGFTLTNAGQSRFYGGIGTSLAGITLSDDLINPSNGGGSQTFKFRSAVGSEASLRDFNQFRIFDESTRTLIAVADVPPSLFTGGTPTSSTLAPTSATSSVPTSSSSAAATSSIKAANSAKPDSPLLGILAAFIYFLV